MKYTLLYPADFFDIKKVDPDYEDEYREAVTFPEFRILFYNYDEFTAGNKLKIYPAVTDGGLCIYRGWMLQTERYRELYQALQAQGLTLINSPEEYENCHEFPNSYPLIKEYTPKMLSFRAGESIDWETVRSRLDRFMIKDYVKSVKGSDFPAFFDCSYSSCEMDEYIDRFIEMRGDLFVKGIVLKEYVDLKQSAGITNEYRLFILNGKRLSLSRNSNQQTGDPVPEQMISSLPVLKSRFYTVDFAECSNGDWIVIETGDGQVSGLSPGQDVRDYYEGLLNLLHIGGENIRFTEEGEME